MKWNNSFALGIEVIDNQHKKIFERLLAIENAVAKRDPWHILRFQLDELGTYMKFHLAVEEAMLEVIRYPGRLQHAESHAEIMKQIAELEEALKQNSKAEDLVRFFENWFLKHVLAGDREYANYIKMEFAALMEGRNA
ncbi:MAG: bacteriohemerythrin [Rhodocyclales bacterium]|nr:bacteriohemerythrin [Rhodocyclales bacterium]